MATSIPAADLKAPSAATDAVLKPSEPVPEGAKQVQGIDFNQYARRAITVEELVGGMANMGFQATSVGEAVRIINEMVSWRLPVSIHCRCQKRRQPMRTPVPVPSLRNSLAGQGIAKPASHHQLCQSCFWTSSG